MDLPVVHLTRSPLNCVAFGGDVFHQWDVLFLFLFSSLGTPYSILFVISQQKVISCYKCIPCTRKSNVRIVQSSLEPHAHQPELQINRKAHKATWRRGTQLSKTDTLLPNANSKIHPCAIRPSYSFIPWTYGRLCLSSFVTSTTSSTTDHQVWITSSLHLSSTIACVKSRSIILQVQNRNMSRIRQQCRSLSRS